MYAFLDFYNIITCFLFDNPLSILVLFFFGVLIIKCLSAILLWSLLILYLSLKGPKFFFKKYFNFLKYVIFSLPSTVLDLAKSYYRDFMLTNRYPFVDKSISEDYVAKKQMYFYYWCFKALIFEDIHFLLNNKQIYFFINFNIFVFFYDLVHLIKLIFTIGMHFIKVLFFPLILRLFFICFSIIINLLKMPINVLINIIYIWKVYNKYSTNNDYMTKYNSFFSFLLHQF